ncbi:MAG TPA: VWA domain-containing protein [Ignavibacteria bacterium]|nr:VWA domain-containing protein [Ignavibacteria bacterium]HMR41833.1 VWA domain-containing protein [Ignavibacteria bacterium]
MKNLTILFTLLFALSLPIKCKTQNKETLHSDVISDNTESKTISDNTKSAAEKNETPSPVIFIYDASGSMWEQIDGKTKMDIASKVLTNSVNGLPDDQKIGFVAYGHRNEGDCEDVEFIVDVESGTKDRVAQSLSNLKPLGKTPLAYSMMQVINKLKESKIKATVILVTDGNESCNGNLCEVVKAAKKEGIDFRLHIIGFGLKEGDTKQLECSAQAGDGQYYDAADAGGLSEVLNQATNTSVDEPAGNLSLYTVTNGKAIDAYIKIYNTGSTESIKAVRTYGDTAFVYLPSGSYDIKVQPLGSSDLSALSVSGIECFEDKVTHKNISFDGSQLTVNVLNNGEGWDAVVKIKEKGNNKVVASSRTYGKQIPFELNPGTYDIEITALTIEGEERIKLIENVSVTGTESNNIEHNYKTGIAMIGASSSNGLEDVTISIVDVNTKKNVAGGRTYTSAEGNPKKFILTPGTYEVTLKAIKLKGQKETFPMTIQQGQTFEKKVSF